MKNKKQTLFKFHKIVFLLLLGFLLSCDKAIASPPSVNYALTTTNTRIMIQFQQLLNHSTVAKEDFSVASNLVSSLSVSDVGSYYSFVYLDLQNPIGDGDTPDIIIADQSIASSSGELISGPVTVKLEDGIEPRLLSARKTSRRHIEAQFSEDLDDATILNAIDNFSILYFYDPITYPPFLNKAETDGLVSFDLRDDVGGGAEHYLELHLSPYRNVKDIAGNPLSGFASVTIEDKSRPTIYEFDEIGYDDADGSGTKNRNDTIGISFFEHMDTNSITADNVDSRLGLSNGHTFGTAGNGMSVRWFMDVYNDQKLKITLGSNSTVAGGDTINPTDDVVDLAGNSDDSTNQTIPNKDNVHPTVVSAKIVTANQIDVAFSEDLNGSSLQYGRFDVESNTVISATEISPGTVRLNLQNNIPKESLPHITALGACVYDVAGNYSEWGHIDPTDDRDKISPGTPGGLQVR